MAKAERNEETPTGPRYTSILHGHETEERQLLDTYRSGRMHHAWLISGREGIGKATLAHRLARFVLAHPHAASAEVASATNLAVSDDHPVTRRIRARAFPDLVEIAAETTQTAAGRARPAIKVEHVHTGLRALDATSGAGGWRVIIVDAADHMNPSAANAILKRLEEPPARTLFVLISHNPGRLLPTIRSRCRKLDLEPLAETDLRAVVADMREDMAPGDVPSEIVALSGGSSGEALRLMNEGGGELARELMKLIASLPNLDMSGLHKLASRLTGQKADPEFRLFCDFLLDWLAESVRATGTGQPGRFQRLEPAGGFAVFRGVSLAQWAALWENLAHAHGQTLGLNLDRKQFLLNAFFALEATARSGKPLTEPA